MHLDENVFNEIRTHVYDISGIFLNDQKIALVKSRLYKRVKNLNITFAQYSKILQDSVQESNIVIDLITTNETYFFREKKHFEFLLNTIIPKISSREKFRVWSCGSSIGCEAYSAAMVIDDHFFNEWEIVGSDINNDVIKIAQQGCYDLRFMKNIDEYYLKKYCLKGVNNNSGKFIIKKSLKRDIIFLNINLNKEIPDIGVFDIIFFRNVLIYFLEDKRLEIVAKVVKKLKVGGFLFLGHSETIQRFANRFSLEYVTPSVYIKR